MIQKSFCSINTCTGCQSLFFVKTARRYCYEDKYELRAMPEDIQRFRYRFMGKIHYLATGVIDHPSFSDNNSDQTCEWEKNFDSIFKDRSDNYVYLFTEVCKSLDIDFNKFIAITDKIFKQMGAFNNE